MKKFKKHHTPAAVYADEIINDCELTQWKAEESSNYKDDDDYDPGYLSQLLLARGVYGIKSKIKFLF